MFGQSATTEPRNISKALVDLNSLPKEWHLLQTHGNRAVIILPCDSPNEQIDIQFHEEKAVLTLLKYGKELKYQVLSCRLRPEFIGDNRIYDLTLVDQLGTQKHVIIKNIAGQSIWYGLGNPEETRIYTSEENVSLYDKVEATCD